MDDLNAAPTAVDTPADETMDAIDAVLDADFDAFMDGDEATPENADTPQEPAEPGDAPEGDPDTDAPADAGDDATDTTDEADDSDVNPDDPNARVALSDPTGDLPQGTMFLDLDAGVVCNVSANVAQPFSVCSSQSVDLSITDDFNVTPASLGGNITTDGTGEFSDAAGNVITGGPFALGTAVSYQPSAQDARRGFVTFTLTTNDPAALGSPCEPDEAMIRIEVLKVDCGTFPAGGN